jgi:uncharacterized protein (DUF2141 family)
MKRPRSLVLAVFAALTVCRVIVSAGPQGQLTPVRDARKEPAGTGAIGGVVQDASGQRPLRRASVRLSGDQLLTGRSTVTRDDGSFLFDGLPPGSYNVSAQRATYMNAEHGARRPGGTGSAIVLAAGQRVTNVVFLLQRFGSIAGVIHDPDGLPAAGISVEAFRYTMRTGRRTLSSVYGQPSFTDDRGVYRIFGLLPGEYYIAAGPSPDRGPSDLQRLSANDVDRFLQRLNSPSSAAPFVYGEPHQSFAPVFFPGSTDFAGAQRIAVALGEDRAGVDLRLQLVPTARVDGTVTRLDGQPLAVTQVVATRITEANSMDLFSPGAAGAATVDAQGKFAYPALVPGRYVMTARSSGVPGMASSATPPMWAMEEVVVGGTDHSVALVLQSGMRVSGRIAYDGKTLLPPAGPSGIRVGLTNMSVGTTLAVSSATANADGTFALHGVPPGQYRLTATAPPAPAGWALRSAMSKGVDVLDIPLVVASGADIDDVVVTYTDRPTELSGSLQTEAGDPTSDYFIVAFSADRSHWAPFGRRQVMARPSSSGRFVFRNLPPGEYFIAAVIDVEQGDWFDPAFLDRLIPASARVTLAEGERKPFDLKIAR